jgi:APA family basic amino acid/polyamine antiporter
LLNIHTRENTPLHVRKNYVQTIARFARCHDDRRRQHDRVGVTASLQIFGASGTTVMAVLLMISTFGCDNGLILSGARVYYTMARDGVFFRRIGVLNRNAVPSRALWIQCVWASALCLSGKYNELLEYVIFVVLIFYILTILGIFRLRKTKPDWPRPYKAFGYPVLPLLYIVAAGSICVLLLLYKPKFTWPGLGIVLLGIPIYYAITRSNNKNSPPAAVDVVD